MVLFYDKLYFVKYDDPNAKSITQEFEIKKHPVTIIIDKNNHPVLRINGFDQNKPKLIEDEVTEVLK
ncbi:hypothetical protein [Desulfosporosinus acididurans]|uniref:hypothetical protein n=1 Tax=Desulfosporosinus acididurans TaxID=476652 RepID=UPI00064B1A56|nr:hypothetical protein [Desulfosporosinus acididurans]